VKKSLIYSILLLILSSNAYASGIHFEEVTIDKMVAESTFILQGEYIEEDKDDHGPHSRYKLKKVIYAAKENVGADLKIWAAHAEDWGIAMALAEETGATHWFTVPEYKGKGRVMKPVKGKSYILLLKQLSRETDFAFFAQGALLDKSMINEIALLIEKVKAM